MSDTLENLRIRDAAFAQALEDAIAALGKLVNALDENGAIDDHNLRTLYGEDVLQAFVEADRAHSMVEGYFLDDVPL